MSQFTFKAKTSPKDIITGVIEADTQQMAVAKIVQLGYVPMEVFLPSAAMVKAPVKTATKSSAAVVGGSAVPLAVLAAFVRDLYDLLDAGVPILKSLRMMLAQQNHPAFHAVLEKVAAQVQDGASLSQAMSSFPRVFPSLFVQMIRSGELSGKLVEILQRLSEFAQKDMELRSKVSSSLIYPAVIMGVGVLSMFVLMTFVLPRLTVLFEDFDAALPAATQVVLAISGFLSQFWWIVVLVVGGISFYIHQFSQTPVGKQFFDDMSMRLPVMGPFLKEVQLSRFSRTLGTLIDNGVSIVPALESAWSVLDNVVIKEQLRSVVQGVREGSSLAVAMKNSKAFPDLAISLVAVAQEAGRLQKGLFKFADACERKAENLTKTFIALLGPLVLVGIVGLVGFVIVSMLLPILQMNMIVN